MGEFFKGWRRKIGCVMLLLASLFAAEWLRSLTYLDTIIIPLWHDSGLCYLSANGHFTFDVYISDELPTVLRWDSMLLSVLPKIHEAVEQAGGDSSVLKQLIPSANFESVSFALVALPLTMLSAYLILKKPRQTTSKKISESIPADGA